MGTTPNHALPYPVSSDLVTDGAAAIQALAEAVDALDGDPWHTVGDPGEPTFNAGYTHADAVTQPAQFRLAFGVVWMRGLVGGPVGNAFTLPVGYRPSVSGGTAVRINGSGHGQVDVSVAGVVSFGVKTGGTPTLWGLDFAFSVKP